MPIPKSPDMKQARIQMLLKSAADTTQEQGIIAGVANITSFVDLGDDRIMDGAFNKTLADHGGKFPLELDHGWGLAAEVGVGYFSVSGHNFQLDRGVLNLANKRVSDEVYPTLLMRAEHGIQAGLSIVYSVVKARMSQEGDRTIREIQEIKLYKVGIVDDPMCQNEDGTVGSFLTLVKSLPSPQEPSNSAPKKENPIMTKHSLGTHMAATKGAISDTIALRSLEDPKWEIDSAFRAAQWSIMADDTLDAQAKLSALGLLIDEYKGLLMDWTSQILALSPDDEDEEKKADRQAFCKAIINPEITRETKEGRQITRETKEGRRLSATTTDAFTKCVKGLDDSLIAYNNLTTKHAAELKAHSIAMAENLKGLKDVISNQPDDTTGDDDEKAMAPQLEVKSLLELIQAELKRS